MAEYIKQESAIRALLNDSPEQVNCSRKDAADCIRYMDAANVSPVRHGRGRSEDKRYTAPSVAKRAGTHGQVQADIATTAPTAERRWTWRNDMKIKEVNDEKILFDNGNAITFDHEQD